MAKDHGLDGERRRKADTVMRMQTMKEESMVMEREDVI